MKCDIVLAGVGGQGILTIAAILGAAAMREGLHIKQAEVHGMSQRGGDVQSNLRISSDPVDSDLISLGGADMIVSLEPMEALRYLPFLSADGWIVTNTVPFVNINDYPDHDRLMEELGKHKELIAFDMDSMAREEASPRCSNMILLGAMSPLIDIHEDKIVEGIRVVFASKDENVIEQNIKAFIAGRSKALTMI